MVEDLVFRRQPTDPGTRPGLRRLELAATLLWLVPLSLVGAAQAVITLRWLLLFPALVRRNVPTASAEFAFLTVVLGICAWGWLRLRRLSRGEACASAAGAVLRLCLVAGLYAFLGLWLAPRFLRVMRAEGETEVKADLERFRGAVENRRRAQGRWPEDTLEALDPARGFDALPTLWAGRWARFAHPPTNRVSLRSAPDKTDTGTWSYVNRAGSPGQGTLTIDCTHTDSAGTRWADY